MKLDFHVFYFSSPNQNLKNKSHSIFSSSSVVVDSFFFFVLLFLVTTTTTNFRSPQLFRPASFKIPTTTIEFLSSSSTKALNLFLDGKTKPTTFFLIMSATKPLCLFCNRSNFVGDHRAGVHLCRAGKVVDGHLLHFSPSW